MFCLRHGLRCQFLLKTCYLFCHSMSLSLVLQEDRVIALDSSNFTDRISYLRGDREHSRYEHSNIRGRLFQPIQAKGDIVLVWLRFCVLGGGALRALRVLVRLLGVLRGILLSLCARLRIQLM